MCVWELQLGLLSSFPLQCSTLRRTSGKRNRLSLLIHPEFNVKVHREHLVSTPTSDNVDDGAEAHDDSQAAGTLHLGQII